MQITDIRVFLREAPQTRLKAYVTITFDQCFVVRNMKIIEGRSGLFVAMPSRKPKVACTKCHLKNDLGSRFCTQCGGALPNQPLPPPVPSADAENQDDLAYRDLAHPITMEFRQYLQRTVLEAYESEKAKGRAGAPIPSGEVDEEL